MTETKITVVTVVFNGEKLLEKTIKSVIGQSYKNIEFIVVDGGSTDLTPSIIKQYESSISKWISEKDSGIYNAMNKGTRMASGNWVCFLNCGDVFVDENTVSKVAEKASTQKADILYGNIFVETKEGTLKERVAAEPCNKHRMYFCHQSAFVKTEIIKQHPFDEKHKMSADFKFFKECYYLGYKFLHMGFPVVVYDTSGISNTSREAGLRDNISVIKETDKGSDKFFFLLKLYAVIWWRKLTKH